MQSFGIKGWLRGLMVGSVLLAAACGSDKSPIGARGRGNGIAGEYSLGCIGR